MREGANRAFGYAVVASILLHALLLLALPALRELAAHPPPAPLIARLAQAALKPAAPPAEEMRKTSVPAAETRPMRQRAGAGPEPLQQAPAPAPAPEHAVASEPAPLAPAAPITPAAPGPVAHIEALPPAPVLDLRARDRFRASLSIAANKFKRYPRAAIDNNWEGEVVVRMVIGADGVIAALGIKTSSGYEILDRQALDMFRVARPFVPLPPELAGKEFELELRAIYSLKDQGSG